MAYIISIEDVKQIAILAASIAFDNFKNLVAKATLRSVSAVSVLLYFTSLVPATAFVSAAVTTRIIFIIVFSMNSLECDNFVSKLPMERVDGQKIAFSERLTEKMPRIFTKTTEDSEIYIPIQNGKPFCSSEPKKVMVKKSNMQPLKTEIQPQIDRKCKTTYVPLEKRTKTWDDLIREDSTENRKKAEPYIKDYEKRVKRHEDRAKIYENRRKLITNKEDEL